MKEEENRLRAASIKAFLGKSALGSFPRA